jgi:peptidoglycan/LPS O-acetylase OafA/YrhL
MPSSASFFSGAIEGGLLTLPKRGSRLDWIEAGRGVAAFLVMVSHANNVHPIPIDPAFLGFLGTTGVAFFFVLSGFIMAHVHEDDIGHPRTAWHFIWRRLGRIFPTYWVALAFALVVNLLLQRASARVDPNLPFLVHNLLILPGHDLLVSQAWTLICELFFYACFVVLLINRRAGQVVLLAWLAVILWHLFFVGPYYGGVIQAPDLYIHQINLYFFAGLATQWAARHRRIGAFALACAAIGALLLVVGQVPGAGPSGEVAAVFGETLAFAFVVAGCVYMSGTGWRAPAFLTWLGAVSYSLYLIHLSVFTVLRGIDHMIGPVPDAAWPVRLLLQMAIATAAAGILHAWFERPMLRWVNSRRELFGLPVGRPGR